MPGTNLQRSPRANTAPDKESEDALRCPKEGQNCHFLVVVYITRLASETSHQHLSGANGISIRVAVLGTQNFCPPPPVAPQPGRGETWWTLLEVDLCLWLDIGHDWKFGCCRPMSRPLGWGVADLHVGGTPSPTFLVQAYVGRLPPPPQKLGS